MKSGLRVRVLGFRDIGLCRDSGKEHGNYCCCFSLSLSLSRSLFDLGLCWDGGKENGNYRSYRGCMGIIGYVWAI